MAITDEKLERIQKRMREARRLRQAQRPKPPGGVVLVAWLDRLMALGVVLWLVLVAEGVWRGPRSLRGDMAALGLVCIVLVWLLLKVAGGLLRGSRAALWFHLLVATYELASVLVKAFAYSYSRVPDGAVEKLLVHALIVTLLSVAAAGGWFRQSENRMRLPRMRERARKKRAVRRGAHRLRLGEST
ncbi:MAG: hypothetical protein QNJ98_17550 [Planctomycetota bacterium]|nr:hypothetical protein [Planctomycetota bacterium]